MLALSVLSASGERVSNTWAICPKEGDNTWKQVLIPHKPTDRMIGWAKMVYAIAFG
ncbi:hypothetical protein LPAF129_21600 [Ligilactobacillus pabuli]|uniref:Uncharacterized protein n=1 Tax=Ligilactobacillus pabuli TaxID=2886039 RepID=A0ABQ5JKC7_9LACO|nr:hypothetical protein LPAF129_21600 [Ligilactobacillus pabuli]